MASSSSTDSKFPIRRAPPVPRGEKSNNSMQDLLTLGNDPFNMQPFRNELNDFNSRGKRAPPRPPPPKSRSSSNYKGLSLILGKDAAKRSKTAATAVVKPLPAAPVATGTLIDFESPSSSPTFSKLSGDLSSVSSSDSGFNYHSKSSSLLESGFDDDFDPFSNGSNRTTPGTDPWSDQFTPPSHTALKPPIKFEIAPHSEVKPRQTGNFVMPTIIGPVKLSKPKRPPQPVNDVLRKNKMNSNNEWRDSSPPMPSAPAPPPPPEAINILLNGPEIPPRPSNTSASASETRAPYCIAEYDYQGLQPDDLSFKEGDVISLLERLNDDWLQGRVHGRDGMFPENYVRIVVPLDSCSTPRGIPVNMTVVALFSFVAQTWDDLDLNEGDEIKVKLRINEDWLYGECNGRSGQFPESFVQDITELLSTS